MLDHESSDEVSGRSVRAGAVLPQVSDLGCTICTTVDTEDRATRFPDTMGLGDDTVASLQELFVLGSSIAPYADDAVVNTGGDVHRVVDQ